MGKRMPTIALVDDDRHILTSVSMALEAEGYSTNTYTDGVTEATNAVKELYGDDRLVAFLNSIKVEDCKAVIDAITNDVDKFCNGSEQADDITMLSVKFTKNLS